MHVQLWWFEVPECLLIMQAKYVSGVVDSAKMFTLPRHTLSKTIP